MADLRSLLAAALGVGLGLLFLIAPGVPIRAHTAGRFPSDRGGEYGSDAAAPDRWRHLVRIVGGALVLLGAYFGAAGLGLV